MDAETIQRVKDMAEIVGIAVRAGVDAERGSARELLEDVSFMLTDPDMRDNQARIGNALTAIRAYQVKQRPTEHTCAECDCGKGPCNWVK